jgi:tetratricopeptide (TPR) repeat protein
MARLKIFLFFLLLHGLIPDLIAQDPAAIDSIRRAIATARTDEDKFYFMDAYSRAVMNIRPAEGDSAGLKLIEFAEETRNRKLMVKAYEANGIRCSYFMGIKDYSRRSIDYYEKALALASDSKLEEEMAGVQLKLANIYLSVPDKDRALNYANQAFSLISTLANDSLRAEGYNTYGHVYRERNEKILSLRNYLQALRLAEEINNASLIRNCYLNLVKFYAGIEAYDKAIDYAMAAYRKLDEMTEKNVPYQRVIDLNSLGNLYSAKKSYDLAIGYFERSIGMADSLHYENLKMPAYNSLLNQYIRMKQPVKALEYFNSPRGRQLQNQLKSYGFGSIIDQAYGVIYTEYGNYDSAIHAFNRARLFFEKTTNETNRMAFYTQLAVCYKKMGENDKAIDLLDQVRNWGQSAGMPEYVELAAQNLDTLYARKENFREARKYNSMYYLYKDSIAQMGKEKEIAQLEANDEQLRIARLQREESERKKRKNNIQYMSITIGIAALFVILAVLGMFRVSPSTIRFIGFFSFLLLFEFIFLLFKKNINSITQGEPWKDLAFMIALAAILVPLHHWMEKKVLTYLTSHNRLTSAGSGIRDRIFRRVKVQEDQLRP